MSLSFIIDVGGAAVDPTVLEELLQPLLEEAQTSPNLMFFDRNIGERNERW
ncbi:hypothetical protein M422DRAFT_275493 [Sphaerobolus stellatus SS14]|uniref:Uncharacterized protein n=1 Tax=Sphaerobolus stellatus (strain SS14) TaxID=990650 RepID=A0A0C9TPK0_SPHS4|nr:hypothetical protein M422DRAFT_275493 [Sphaerobolus stellatus SS14]